MVGSHERDNRDNDNRDNMATRAREQLMRRGAESDDVQLREYRSRWPVPGTRAEKRARRHVLYWLALSSTASISLIPVYAFWPSDYRLPGAEGATLYRYYTPMLGLCAGLALLGFAAALIAHVKRFLPEEVAVQQRHDATSSSAEDKATLAATVVEAADGAGLRRRSFFARAAGVSAGTLGAGIGVVALGGFVRDPWEPAGSARGPADTLWHTGWLSRDGEPVYLRVASGDVHEVKLVRPDDLDPGGALAVVPFRESERDDRELLSKAMHRADNPATLLRLPEPDSVARRPDRAGMDHAGCYAYSRICTHLGCPVSMYQVEENQLLCPCHQSLFDLTRHAEPVFGPAVRALPQLPIAVDETGHFFATGDFTGPVGPSFWELAP